MSFSFLSLLPSLSARYHYDLSSSSVSHRGGAGSAQQATPVDKTLLSPNESLNERLSTSPMPPVYRGNGGMGVPASPLVGGSTASRGHTLAPHHHHHHHHRASSSHANSAAPMLIAPHPADRSNMDSQGRALTNTPSRHPRLLSLDALRGLALLLSILSLDASTVWTHALDSTPWDEGVRLCDFAWGGFLFVTGVAIPLSGLRRARSSYGGGNSGVLGGGGGGNVYGSHRGNFGARFGTAAHECFGFRGGCCSFLATPRWVATLHILYRCMALFFLGLVLDGGDFPRSLSLASLRIPGVLQRVAGCYLMGSLCFVWGHVNKLKEEDPLNNLFISAPILSTMAGNKSFSNGSNGSSGGGNGGNSNAAAGLFSNTGFSNGRLGGSQPDASEAPLSSPLSAASASASAFSSSRAGHRSGGVSSHMSTVRCFLLRKYWCHVLLAALIVAVYLLLTLLAGPDGDDYGGCKIGSVSMQCNTARMLDESLFGKQHLMQNPPLQRSAACSSCSPGLCPFPSSSSSSAAVESILLLSNSTRVFSPPAFCSFPFDPAGFLSSLSSALITLAGLAAGLVLEHEPRHERRLKAWAWPSAIAVSLGAVLHATAPQGDSWRRFNPSLASLPFVALQCGVWGLLLCLCYAVIECQWSRGKGKRFLHPLSALGMNSLLVYILALSVGARLDRLLSFVYWSDNSAEDNVISWFQHSILREKFALGREWSMMVYATIKGGVWMLVTSFLAHRGRFWKL